MENFIKQVALKAGLSLKRSFGKNNKKQKKDDFGDIVTAADFAAEKIIIQAINKKYPDHNILSEEAGHLKSDSKYTWIIDPLDGTKNFANHIPLFATTIAFACKKQILEGVIYDPIHNELFYAKKNHGAFLNNKKIKTSARKEIKNMSSGVASVRSRTNNKFYDELRNNFYNQASSFRVFGSATIDLISVAAGRLDMFILGGVFPWDVAAGGLIIEEAGGIISTISGDKWQPFDNFQELLVSGNKILHKKILRIIK